MQRGRYAPFVSSTCVNGGQQLNADIRSSLGSSDFDIFLKFNILHMASKEAELCADFKNVQMSRIWQKEKNCYKKNDF
jgi:hypothetical protein